MTIQGLSIKLIGYFVNCIPAPFFISIHFGCIEILMTSSFYESIFLFVSNFMYVYSYIINCNHKKMSLKNEENEKIVKVVEQMWCLLLRSGFGMIIYVSSVEWSGLKSILDIFKSLCFYIVC